MPQTAPEEIEGQPEEIGELDSSLLGRPVVTEHGQKLGEVAGFTANTGA